MKKKLWNNEEKWGNVQLLPTQGWDSGYALGWVLSGKQKCDLIRRTSKILTLQIFQGLAMSAPPGIEPAVNKLRVRQLCLDVPLSTN